MPTEDAPAARLRINRADLTDFFTIVVIMLATVFAPPFLRILGSRAWTTLGITEGTWSIFMALRGLFFIIFILAAGVLGDLFGRRRVLLLTLGAFIFLVPPLMVFHPLSAEFVIIYSLWVILGNMIRTLAVTFVILKYRGRGRILALVVYSTLMGAGVLLSPLLANLLRDELTVHLSFIVPLALAVYGLYLGRLHIRESQVHYDAWAPDAVALAVWSFGLCLMIFAGVLSGALGWTNSLVYVGLGAGAVLMLAVSFFSERPLREKWRFKLRYDHKLGMAIFSGAVLNLALYAVTVQVFNFMSRVQSRNVILAGIGLAPILLGALFSLRAARRLSNARVSDAIAIGLVVVALPALWLSLLQPDLPYLALTPALFLIGFGYILGNSPRLLLLASSLPSNLTATAQSIGSATALMGSALAYSFMVTLMEGFGVRAYVQTLESLGLAEQQIALRLTTLARVSEEFSVLAASEEELEVLAQIDYWLVQAYTTGLSQAMLVLAGVCLVSAAVVYLSFRVRRSEQALEPTVAESEAERRAAE